MPAINDGNVPFGAQVITVGSASIVAENITYNEPSTVVELRNEVGTPSAQVAVTGFGNGTATLQLATTASTPVTIGATFTLTRNGGATFSCFFSEVSEAQDQLNIRKQTVSFRRKLN